MSATNSTNPGRGPMMALIAAFLGWMFDGMEMGIFPLVARPALNQMQVVAHIADENFVQRWMGIITALFLLGAACGGLVFGWLGDRIGRVKAMTWSILCYSIFTGACYFAQAPWQLGALRFIAALGMGGEWALGVALVMESWPGAKRPLLAGLIGAAANAGYALIAIIAIVFPITPTSWRWVMMVGAAPALLTFFIRLFVPESERWRESVKRGPARPLSEIFAPALFKNTALAIAFASIALIVTWGIVQWIPLWADQMTSDKLRQRQAGVLSLLEKAQSENPRSSTISQALAGAQAAFQKLARSKVGDAAADMVKVHACLEQTADGAPELVLDSSPSYVQQASARQLEILEEARQQPKIKGYIQLISSIGAILGCLIAPLLGGRLGRRSVYFGLCLLALVACSVLFRCFHDYSTLFLAMMFPVGFFTAAFYGWLPLYLPELFPTRVRATGQGLAFNFGRILAAVGAWQMGPVMEFFGKSYAKAGSAIVFVYLIGMAIIWLAPETKDKPLPE
jgi:SHS family sialic acid transporter-like MFS transporter